MLGVGVAAVSVSILLVMDDGLGVLGVGVAAVSSERVSILLVMDDGLGVIFP